MIQSIIDQNEKDQQFGIGGGQHAIINKESLLIQSVHQKSPRYPQDAKESSILEFSENPDGDVKLEVSSYDSQEIKSNSNSTLMYKPKNGNDNDMLFSSSCLSEEPKRR